MDNFLQKAINLAKKTGDKLIIVDKNDPSFGLVLMNLPQYEKIVANNSDNSRKVKDLTDEELIDKINRDIALWKEAQDFNKKNCQEDNFLWDLREENDDEFDDEELYYYDDDDDLEREFDEDSDSFNFNNFADEERFNDEEPDFDANWEMPDFPESNQDEQESKKTWSIPRRIKDQAEEILDEDNIKF